MFSSEEIHGDNRNVTEKLNRNLNKYGNFWQALSSVVKRITTFKLQNLYRVSRENKIELEKSYTRRNYADSNGKLSPKHFDMKHALNKHKLWKVSESQKRILETTGEAQSLHRNLEKTFDVWWSLSFSYISTHYVPRKPLKWFLRLCLLQYIVGKRGMGVFL